MKEIINKNSLNQSIDLISELNLNEEDYEKVFDKFRLILDDPETKELIESLSGIREINETDLRNIMKKLSDKINLTDLNNLLSKIIKNEDFVDFIQDLFLEKLV